MKFTAIFLFVAAMQASAKGHSQVTLSVKDAPLEQVFASIKQQTGYVFFYSYEALSNATTVTITVRNASLREALNICLKGQPLAFTIEDKTVFISKKTAENVNDTKEKENLPPPPVDIKGRILNEAGEPVAASILVKGTPNGTISNANGFFELKNVDENATLVITGVSIETIEIKVNGRTSIAVDVKTKIAEGQDVIVKTNYWEVKQKENTGNISKVDAKTIAQQPVPNVMAALQGRMPGVYINENSSVPGGGFTIQIRGRNSLRIDGNDPLYVIDGVPYMSNTLLQSQIFPVNLMNGPNPLSVINPLDIESVEVLKDADATAIYGSRGANGVVLITTKKGMAGKTKVDINMYSGTGKVANRVDLLNTQQYLEMRREAFTNDNLAPATANAPDLLLWDQNRYTDWQDELIGGTAHFTNAQVSVSGGNAYTKFLFGAGYNRQTTVFPGDMFYRRGTGNLNVIHASANRKFDFSLSANFSAENNNLVNTDFATDIYDLPPNAPVLYDAERKLNWENGTWVNPLADLEKDYTSNTNNLITNLTANYRLLPGLLLKTSLGYNLSEAKELRIDPISSINPFGTTALTGAAFWGRSSRHSWIAEPQAEYQTRLGNGKLIALVGSTFQTSNQESMNVSALGVDNDELLHNIASFPTASVTTRNTFAEYRYSAIFGRLNYNWNEKYLLNVTARRDGSSRFGPGRRFGNFVAAGVAWIFSNEEFIKKGLPFLSYGKLRASYGKTGSDQIPNYGFFDSYSATAGQYQGPGLQPVRLANPEYSWESNTKAEAAFELGFLQDRIFFAASYYRNRSSSQLVGLPLPGTTGFTSIQYNLPATVQNTGWEFELNTVNVKSNNLTWRTGFNISIPRNKLIAYPGLEGSGFANTYRVGEPLSINLTYEYRGVDPQTGIYMFTDMDGSGTIATADSRKITQSGLNFHGGLSNSISYKGFELNIFFQFVKGIAISYRNSFASPGMMGNQPAMIMQRWQSPGDMSSVQRFSTIGVVNTAYSRWRSSDIAREDASFTRLKNISASWEVPAQIRNKLKLEMCRVYIQGQNLFTFTKYKGLDPENNGLPPLRTITAGVNLSL